MQAQGAGLSQGWVRVPCCFSGNLLLNASGVGFLSLSVSPLPWFYLDFSGSPVKGRINTKSLPQLLLLRASPPQKTGRTREPRPHLRWEATCCHLRMWHLEMSETSMKSSNFQNIAMSSSWDSVVFFVCLFLCMAQTKQSVGGIQSKGYL